MKRVSSFASSAISKHPLFSQYSQLSQQVDDRAPPYIYFVLPPGKNVKQCEKLNLGEMFVAAQAHFLNVKWVTDEEVKEQVLENAGNVFIFDPFGSPGFQHCVRQLAICPRVEILSPTVLRHVFNDPQQTTFDTKDCPVYSLAMKNMIICLSGFKNKATKDELEQLVRWMNGSFSTSLTKAVTHVVTASAITPKCIEANKEQIPVMTEDWIRQVWKDNHSLPVDASHSQYVKFLCPVFYKVNICMSQITAVKKNILKSEVEKQGGKCSSELVKRETDILVVPNPNGDKYKFAQKWNMKCVTPQWIENSIEKGHLLPPDHYIVLPSGQEFALPLFNDLGPITSTPAHSIMPDWNMTRCSAIVDDENRLVVEASKANFTRTSTEIHEETMSKLRSVTDNGPYLDGCKIYVVEYEKSDELKRELNKSGAVRLNQLCEGVTHVIVCGPKLPKSVRGKINELESTPYVVTVGWVLQSAKDGNPAEEELFKYEPMNTICQETYNGPPNITSSSHVGRVSATAIESHPQDTRNMSPPPGPVATSSTKSKSRTAANTKTKSRENSTDDTSKSNSRNNSTEGTSKSNSRENSTDATSKSKSTTTTEEVTTNSKSGATTNNTSAGSASGTGRTESEDSDTTQEGNGTSDSHNVNEPDDASSPGLFVGITFKVVISDEEEQLYLQNLISDNGGSLVKENPEVAILSPICSPIEKDRADKSYTKYWLFDCLEFGSLDINNSFYHVPMPHFKKMEDIMHGVVVAISQYPGTERAYIIEAVTAMGARYQDVFARKDSNDGKNIRSTHLICKNMDTDKAKAAKKWSVPVVVGEWVTDSFNAKKRLEENKYDPSLINTSDERTVFMPTPQRRRTLKQNANGNFNNNMSVRSIYPPSTQKARPNVVLNKDNGNVSPVKVNSNDKEKTPPPEPQPSTSKSAKPGSSKDVFRTPTSHARKPPASTVPSSTSNKASKQPSAPVEANRDDDGEEDSFLKTLPQVPPQEEIDRKMAEFKAMFPYSDDSYNRLAEDIKARGIDLDAVSPFTSFEDRRLCDPNPDSPIMCGLPRHESRALKEQFEIALNRTPNIPTLKVKTPASTPLHEIVRRFNSAMNARAEADSPTRSPLGTSTPNQNLRRRATLNRLSQGNPNASIASIGETEDNEPINPLAGIRKLRNKRPSDSSPDEEDAKSSKRARTSSEEDNDIEEQVPTRKPTSPNENNVPSDEGVGIDNENPISTKSADKIQHLTNLIAESHANPTCDRTGGSPIKRRSADNVLVPCDGVNEEIEQPHLSWVENDEDERDKRSTVKKGPVIARIAPAGHPQPAQAEAESGQEREGRKRSSRLRKASSVVNAEEGGGGRVTRQTRARSRSKTRKEGSAPLGHQPIKINEGKKSKRKKAVTFPIDLPDNPVFGLSSLDQREKTDATKIVQTLGGSISKAANFDLNCHALITTRLLRSEKILGCIGSGKYLLKPEYLTKSQEAGRFLPIDEEFLWHESNINEDKERELARASYGWLKLQMEDKDKRPMAGMKFHIVDQVAEKVKAFERLILASGGEVAPDIKDATCVIKDEKTAVVIPEGMQVANPLYLNTLILTVPQSS